VNFTLRKGGCLALVGESGSGKTTIARAIAGLHPHMSGDILLGGESVAYRSRRRALSHRRYVQLVFQNPADALNPRHTVRVAISRPASVLRGLRGKALDDEVTRMLDSVRLPARLARRYPHELSGGERQRVAIARALAAEPTVLVCDEVTSALDVSVQAAVLDLLMDLREQAGVALLFITHDLGVVSVIADEVMVLERGAVCEVGATGEILSGATHPYTQTLLASAPSLTTALDAWSRLDDESAAAQMSRNGLARRESSARP
jgi:peptide/nickel transport system ATP-binding protein